MRPARRAACLWLALFSLQQAGFSQTPDCGCRYQAAKFKAYLHSAQEKPDSALFYFKAAFSGGHAAMNDLLMAADRAIQVDSIAAARHFMLRTFDLGQTMEGYRNFIRWSGRGKVGEQEWIRADTIARILARHRAGLDTALVGTLKRLEYGDQRFRGDDDEAHAAERAAQDSLNAVALKKMVAALGRLPNCGEVGFEGIDILGLLFLHMNLENFGWFLPHILQQVRRCEYFHVEGLAYQIDRIAVSSGMALYIDQNDQLRYDTLMPPFVFKQYYSVTGHWYDISPSDGANYFWPVFGPLLNGPLQTTRKRLCLDPYEQYLQRNPYIKTAPEAELKKLFGG